MKKLLVDAALPLAFVFLSACGSGAPTYESGVPQAAQNSTGAKSQTPQATGTSPATGAKTNPGTQVKPGTAAKPGATPAPATPAPAAPAPGTPAPNQAQLVTQGTTIFAAKCASCHGPIAQKANDIRVNMKTAAQLTAAKTTKPIPHGAVVWPLATEMPALEAALK